MTYKTLTSEYFKRNARLNTIAKKSGRKTYLSEPLNVFFTILTDLTNARRENTELWNYQMRRAYE